MNDSKDQFKRTTGFPLSDHPQWRPRRYIGPRRFGYPPIRESGEEGLEDRVVRLERALRDVRRDSPDDEAPR